RAPFSRPHPRRPLLLARRPAGRRTQARRRALRPRRPQRGFAADVQSLPSGPASRAHAALARRDGAARTQRRGRQRDDRERQRARPVLRLWRSRHARSLARRRARPPSRLSLCAVGAGRSRSAGEGDGARARRRPARRAGGPDPDRRARVHPALRPTAGRPRRAARRPPAAASARLRRTGSPGDCLVTKTYDIAAFRALIGAIKCEDNPVLVKQKSRDFYWYSPILKRELDAVTADIVVSPVSEAEVGAVLKAAHELRIPVTARGGGTGNYGQAMPLTGGVLLNLIDMNKIVSMGTGRVVSEPGAIIADIDKAAAASGQELRMFPSTRGTASIGGFIAGGSGGIGSITWGGLRDFGNVLRLRVTTMEKEPRTLELTGEDLHKAVHAYGTNGVITEVEMPLTARYDWVDVIVGFDSFDAAASYALALGEQVGILKKLVTVVAGPAPHDYFLRHRALIPPGKSVVLTMIAPHALDAFGAFTRPYRSAEILLDSSRASPGTLAGLPPNYELTWNHTTLRALRVDPRITYLQARYRDD